MSASPRAFPGAACLEQRLERATNARSPDPAARWSRAAASRRRRRSSSSSGGVAPRRGLAELGGNRTALRGNVRAPAAASSRTAVSSSTLLERCREMTSASDRLVDRGGREPVRRSPFGARWLRRSRPTRGAGGRTGLRRPRARARARPPRESSSSTAIPAASTCARAPARRSRPRRAAQHLVSSGSARSRSPMRWSSDSGTGSGSEGSMGPATGVERACELKGIERVPAGHLVQPEHRRPRKCPAPADRERGCGSRPG